MSQHVFERKVIKKRKPLKASNIYNGPDLKNDGLVNWYPITNNSYHTEATLVTYIILHSMNTRQFIIFECYCRCA